MSTITPHHQTFADQLGGLSPRYDQDFDETPLYWPASERSFRVVEHPLPEGRYSLVAVAAGYEDRTVLAELIGVSPRTVLRYLADGLSWAQADTVACRLGVHPSALWPTWLDDVEPDDIEIDEFMTGEFTDAA